MRDMLKNAGVTATFSTLSVHTLVTAQLTTGAIHCYGYYLCYYTRGKQALCPYSNRLRCSSRRSGIISLASPDECATFLVLC